MFEDPTRRDGLVAAIIPDHRLGCGGGMSCGLHQFVLDRPADPVTKQSGLKPDQVK
jgi:hypothetical protein